MRYSKRGKRGGRNQRGSADRERDIHSKIDGLPSAHFAGHAHNLHGSSATAAVAEKAKYCESALIEERADTHVIPRQSETRKQLLSVFPQIVEMEVIPTRHITLQRDKVTGAIVEVADEVTDRRRVTFRSDRSLLRQGNPFADAEHGKRIGYKRDGSVSVGANTRKYRDALQNAVPVEPVVLGEAIEDEPFWDEIDIEKDLSS
jgi:hypothetical protein